MQQKKKIRGQKTRLWAAPVGLSGLFPLAATAGVVEHCKYQFGPSDPPPCGRVPGFQALSLRVSGVPPEADQVSGKRNIEAEH